MDDIEQMFITVRAERDELLDTLVDVINQSCTVSDVDIAKGNCAVSNHLDSCALTAYADAMRLLAKHGRLTISTDVGRHVIGHWKEANDAT